MANDEPYGTQYDVVVIGGGVTGTGTLRDCALRGLRALLVERDDLCTGTSGRNHGLMHSGARYAVTDVEGAAECVSENKILRRIARHCVEETDGLFVTLADDDLGYQSDFVAACRQAGIAAEVIDPAQALSLEPALVPTLQGAVRVPDAAIDPFRVAAANVLDARLHGAQVLTYHEVTGMIVEQDRVTGVRLLDKHTGQRSEVRAHVVINAAGIWGQQLLSQAGVTVKMFPAKGALLIFGRRLTNMVINRCRRPADADIVVPDGKVCMSGTTSDRVSLDAVDDMRVTEEEVRVLLAGASALVPAAATTSVLRAYAGVRPLVASDDDPTGRNISRGIVCLDHGERDGVRGLLTITGGKMMTYRLMAERVTDLACRQIGNSQPCVTATEPLPGSNAEEDAERQDVTYSFAQRAARERHGTMADHIPADTDLQRALVCECQGVSVGELQYAVEQLQVCDLTTLRRRTRLGMGNCQGKLCSCRAACLLGQIQGDIDLAQNDLYAFLDERWKGMKPVAWGDTLSEAQLIASIYQGLCGLGKAVDAICRGKEDEK